MSDQSAGCILTAAAIREIAEGRAERIGMVPADTANIMESDVTAESAPPLTSRENDVAWWGVYLRVTGKKEPVSIEFDRVTREVTVNICYECVPTLVATQAQAESLKTDSIWIVELSKAHPCRTTTLVIIPYATPLYCVLARTVVGEVGRGATKHLGLQPADSGRIEAIKFNPLVMPDLEGREPTDYYWQGTIETSQGLPDIDVSFDRVRRTIRFGPVEGLGLRPK